LKENYSINNIAHFMQLTARVPQRTGFFCSCTLAKVGKAGQIFQNPIDVRMRDCITGRIG